MRALHRILEAWLGLGKRFRRDYREDTSEPMVFNGWFLCQLLKHHLKSPFGKLQEIQDPSSKLGNCRFLTGCQPFVKLFVKVLCLTFAIVWFNWMIGYETRVGRK